MMIKIQSIDELNPLINSQLKRGVITNTFLSAEEYNAEISNLALYAEEFDGGLYIFRQRDGYRILNFYLQQGLELQPLLTGEKTVCEFPYRLVQSGIAEELDLQIKNIGFNLRFERTRLKAKPPNSDTKPEFADAVDYNAVSVLMSESFDRYAGCIPPKDALMDELQSGHIICVRDGAEMLGILHFYNSKAYSEIRHLAVSSKARHKGIATKLCEDYFSVATSNNLRVWTQSDNTAALALYEKIGYTRDSWFSNVYIN